MLKAWGLIILIGLSCCAWAQENWEKAAELRRNDEFGKAEKLLKDYSSPANFDSLSTPEKIKFLRGLLELAHLKALQDDVAGSLALLNWAEARTDEYQRSIACIKYGEILLDLGEFERSSAYLTNADEIIAKRVIDSGAGAAIGQGGEQIDTGAAWRELRDQSDALKAEIEAEQMKVKFGATYGSYVKLRRLQSLIKRSKTPRYRNEALKVADEIIETDPASQFAAAAGYLKGEIMASRLTENSPKKEIAEVKTYLNSFVKAQPEGLYRGEALMLLGKISLEIEWNAKESEKYYTQALDYFRKAREKRDALSLYAAINDDLKNQSMPTQKPTTLNQWKRIVYHDEDPLKLYNTGNAPTWYINDKEKNCIFVTGFFKYTDGKYDEAMQIWETVGQLDPEIAGLDNLGVPNTLGRLKAACQQKKMIFSEEERKSLSNNIKLKIAHAELLFGLEQFEQSKETFSSMKSLKITDYDKAAILIGIGYCDSMKMNTIDREKRIEEVNKTWKVANKLAQKTPLERHSLWMIGASLISSTTTQADALPYFEEFIQKYPEDANRDSALFSISMIKLSEGKHDETWKIYREFKNKKPDSKLVKEFERIFKLENIDPNTGRIFKNQ